MISLKEFIKSDEVPTGNKTNNNLQTWASETKLVRKTTKGSMKTSAMVQRSVKLKDFLILKLDLVNHEKRNDEKLDFVGLC